MHSRDFCGKAWQQTGRIRALRGETGGLKVTVVSYNEQTGQGNGFSFADSNAQDFRYTICRALRIF
ncbi:MAG: hypothetical protein OSJ68_03225 [Clostridia bacterium]|nr:hypothetical protein [Clostridia bacterium]